MLGKNVVYVTEWQSHRPTYHRPGYEDPRAQATKCGLHLSEPVCMQRAHAEHKGATACADCFPC